MLKKQLPNRGNNSLKGKAKVTFSNQEEGLFTEIDKDNIPSIMREKIEAIQKIQQSRAIKVKINPHGWIVTFFISFMNVYYTDIEKFKQNVEKMYQLLDSDEFMFFKNNNKDRFTFTQWSNSKIKRLLAEGIKDVMQGKYKMITEIFRVNGELSKLLFLFSVTLLFYCEKIDDHDQFIDLRTVNEELFEYFDLGLEVSQKGVVKINDANVSVYSFHRTDLYIILGQGQYNGYDTEEKSINDSIRLSKLSSIDSEPYYDIKGEIVQNHGFLKNTDMKNTDSSETNKDKDNFYDLTNQICNTHHQSQSSINTFRVNLNRDNNGNTQFSFMNDEVYHEDNNKQNHNEKLSFGEGQQSSKGKIILSTQGTEWTGGKNCQQHEIDKLFEMKSHQATTQKSIYDDPQQGEAPEDQYSFLDEYLPAARRSTIKKTMRQQQASQQQQQQGKSSQNNETLMNKWYDFIRERRNKAKNVQVESEKQVVEKLLSGSRTKLQQKLRSSVKKILVQQPSRLTSNQKPDFKKIKQRRRNAQQQSQNQQKAFTSSCQLKSMKSQGNFSIPSNTYLSPTINSNAVHINKPPLLSIQQLGRSHSNNKPQLLSIQQLWRPDSKQFYSSPLQQSRKMAESIMLSPESFSQVKQNNSLYMNQMKITEEFTDSVILDQLNQMNQTNVKLMKENARKERASLGYQRRERKTVK